jgi:hypothetical protein
MTPLNPSSPVDPRGAINARCRRNALIQIGILVPTCGLYWWLESLYLVFSDFFRFAFYNFFVTLFVGTLLLDKKDVCPKCKSSIATLPSGGNFLALPELSDSIRMCPYCGEDFSCSDPAAVDEVELPQLWKRK